MEFGNGDFGERVAAGFHDEMTRREILQAFGEWLSPVERSRNELGVHRGKLEVQVIADGGERRAHFRRKLFQKLIRREYSRSKFAGLRQERFEISGVPDEVLYFVETNAHEVPALPCEDGVPDARKAFKGIFAISYRLVRKNSVRRS